jgi:hypothetical protein
VSSQLRELLTGTEGAVAPSPVSEATSEEAEEPRGSGLLGLGRGRRGRGNGVEPAGENVYESLKGSVEKVGDHWVPKENGETAVEPSDEEPAEAPAPKRTRRSR